MTDSVGRAITLNALSPSSSSKVLLSPVNVLSLDCMSWMFDTI